jgi:SOS response regulatory protein OraA/RecX
VPSGDIEEAVGSQSEDEQSAIKTIIEQKRRQARYQDDLKLMQYLARQGFNYGDIKDALKDE